MLALDQVDGESMTLAVHFFYRLSPTHLTQVSEAAIELERKGACTPIVMRTSCAWSFAGLGMGS